MLKEFLLLISCIFFYNQSFSQVDIFGISSDSIKIHVQEKTVDLDAICTNIRNVKQKYDPLDGVYYYYGSVFLKDYNPYGEEVDLKDVYNHMDEGDFVKAEKMTLDLLDASPGNIKMFRTLAEIYYELKDSTQSSLYYNRFLDLLSVPLSSGNGYSMDSAYVVRLVGDEYLILNELKVKSQSQSLLFDDNQIPFDMLKTDAILEEERKVYFNIYFPFKLGMINMFSKDSSDEKTEKNSKVKKKKRKKKKKKKRVKKGK
ncbi:MAG: DUF4919 domain-containing protein [Flavobacteriales bacterium]